MHYHALTLALLSSATSTLAAQPYSTWMATSFLSKGQKINNHYVANVLYEGIQKAATFQKNATLLATASKAISSIVSSNGTIAGYDPYYYSLDDIRTGNNILYFWDSEGRKEKKYEIAAAALRDQLNRWPRTPTGGFWHRDPTYPNQMWLDGIYMADTFYATYTSYFDVDNTTAWNDIALQFDLIESHTRNKTSNLLQHGYDESKKAVWADPVTGASPHVWDRAVGWYMMALVEVLQVYPKNLSGYNRAVGWYMMALVEVLQVYPKNLSGYNRLKGYLTTLAEGVKKAQDTSGGWWLVMDEPYPGKKGNYIESSATAMFTYAYLKGVRTGLLAESYRDTASKAYDLMLQKFVTQEKNGTLSWEGTVQVGSLSGNASYEYYIGVPLSQNDGKGAGPFMFAAVEMEMWKGS